MFLNLSSAECNYLDTKDMGLEVRITECKSTGVCFQVFLNCLLLVLLTY